MRRQEMLEKLGLRTAGDSEQGTVAEPPAVTGVPARPQLARGVVVAGGAVARVGAAAGAVRLAQDWATSTASTAIPTPPSTSTPEQKHQPLPPLRQPQTRRLSWARLPQLVLRMSRWLLYGIQVASVTVRCKIDGFSMFK